MSLFNRSMKSSNWMLFSTLALVWLTPACAEETQHFPYKLPETRPDIPLSKAMDRLYSQYSAAAPEWSELSSNFKFTRLKGLDYRGGDGTVLRRDPSKIIRVGELYYVWRTKRDTATAPQGPDFATETIPSTDWDLSEIWYATSPDGFIWTEQGLAIERPPHSQPGWRSVSTTDILVWKGKYYLYYKSDANGRPLNIRMHGLATANHPLGPFTKHPLNPVMNSGHETTLFPFKTGMAALAIHSGLEHNTVQYSPDGVNFHVESTATYMPIATGPYIADAFTDTKYGRGISWGLSHFTGEGEPGARYSILGRFDCDLSLDVDDPIMKNTAFHIDADTHFKQGLDKTQRERIEADSTLP